MSEPTRHYGHDVTDDYETLAEIEQLPDGTLHLEVVIVDKRDR